MNKKSANILIAYLFHVVFIVMSFLLYFFIRSYIIV